MAAQTILGSATFTEQPQEKTKQQGQGWIVTRTWLGPKDNLDDFVSGTVLPLNPQDVDVSYGTPAVVRATFPDLIGNTLSTDALQEAEDEAVWELIPMQLDKPLATHPAFAKSGSTPAIIERIEKAIREGTATETDWDTDFGVTNMNDYRNLRVKGTDSYRAWTWMIRKTIAIGKAVDLAAEEVNTQKIVTYNDIGLPSDVKWAQPKYQSWDGEVITPYSINEWMATPPVIRWVKSKYEVTREWIGAVKWYSIMYQGGTAASDEAGI